MMAMWWCILGIVHSPSLKGRYRSFCNWIHPLVSASIIIKTDRLFLIPIAADPTTHAMSDPQTDPLPKNDSLPTSAIAGEFKHFSALSLPFAM